MPKLDPVRPAPRLDARASGVSAWTTTVLVLAGLAGAGGVAAAAAAAHATKSAQLAAAAQILMVHAGTAVAIVAVSLRASPPGLWLAVASLMLAGAILFGADVALSSLRGVHIFPMAAPTGGSVVIASWLALAGAAIRDQFA